MKLYFNNTYKIMIDLSRHSEFLYNFRFIYIVLDHIAFLLFCLFTIIKNETTIDFCIY
jgi:hypothetical protein